MSHKTGLEDYYIIKNNKKMRFGYTTGSCAAAASKAAAEMLFSGNTVSYIKLNTPKGIELDLEILHIERGENAVKCAVKKDAGDDPDMTNGIEVFAEVSFTKSGKIEIDGGKGVGRVRKPGLEQPVGNAAINRVPREMIMRELEDICSEYDYEQGLKAVISVPAGEETAKKTFNPRLGIEGGISILGTSGIVEPMSEAALIKSIEVEMKQKLTLGYRHLLITPGNYGLAYLKDNMKELPLEDAVKCSNYVGETIDMAIDMGAEGILFISHIGKFVKVAGGIMNTHSRNADGRAEIIAANAIRAGISNEGAKKILDTLTTDEALKVVDEEGLLEETMKEITDRISFYLKHRSYGRLKTGAVIYSNVFGYLGETEEVKDLVTVIKNESEVKEGK